jgi:hypothetical protein
MNDETERQTLKDFIKENMFGIRIKYFMDGSNFYPGLVDPLPQYAEEAESFIRERAKRDLPAIQFEGKVFKNGIKPEELVEAGGVLGYSDKLDEISYGQPSVKNVTIGDGKISSRSQTMRSERYINAKTKDVIVWHSHPTDSPPSENDMNNVVKHNSVAEDLDIQVYDVLYIPQTDEFLWMQSKKITEYDMVEISQHVILEWTKFQQKKKLDEIAVVG